jgi:hypothetical protein
MEPRGGQHRRNPTVLPKVAKICSRLSGRVCYSIFAKVLNKILLPRRKEKHLLWSGAAVVSNEAVGTWSMLLLLVGGIVVTSNYLGEFHGVKGN